MIPQELAEQLRAEVKGLNEVQAKFLQTFNRLCVHYGGPEWRRSEIATVFHGVRQEVIPVMAQAGMDPKTVETLCSWAEKRVMQP